MERLAQLFQSQASVSSASTSSFSRASQLNQLHRLQKPDQSSDDYEELECDLQQLLDHYKFHPLNYFFLSNIVLIGKTDEFDLYQVFSNELEQKFLLKVINDEKLFECEKRIIDKLEGTLSTLKMNNAFTFEFPVTQGGPQQDRQFYFIFEPYKENLIQIMTQKQSQKSKTSNEKVLYEESQPVFSEKEMRNLAGELIEVFGDLQRKRICHRNIKPANILRMDYDGEKNLRVYNFEWAVELQALEQFNNVDLNDSKSAAQLHDQDQIPMNVEACSMVYASPLVIKQFMDKAKSKDKDETELQKYNPFKEDVFGRPDFIQLEQIYKDLIKMDDCKQLLYNLTNKEDETDNIEETQQQQKQNLYKTLYQNVDQFLELKKREVQEIYQNQSASTPSSSSQRFSPQKSDCKFHIYSPQLICPVHDDEKFKYFCRKDQEFVCEYCLVERHQDHNIEDLSDKSKYLKLQFQAQLESAQNIQQLVQTKKSSIRSGKHIDQFFDGIFQSILVLHQQVKDKYRERIDDNQLQFQFEKHCKKQETKFKADLDEINSFIEEERFAETYTNLEYYEDQIRQMEKLKQNMSIYDNLLENETEKLGKHSSKELLQLKNDILKKIKVYINKNM
ncbi:protein kinase domain containing protein [Stylonychia lemnae]|uniref:Protein kinase domain containing protein n=1 Tax=Stylonychia lemnae TaxID=5949 RepID=A0A078B0A1_STYLE|nr:protein kinase domain containing protein [Stylonychia lemnae]|eukprot:CDW87924.1 protein kinase domain containing protein [Stylonychia lemnae]